MRILLLLSLLAMSADLVGQAGQAKPTTPAPAPTQPTPPTQKPAPASPRRPAAASTRSGMAITVTDGQGGALAGVRVEVMGATDRSGETNPSGQINFPGMPAGTYRVRFSDDSVITFEREVVLRGGQVADVDVTLNPAPRREPPPAPAPAPVVVAKTPVGPLGQPQTLSLVDLAERELISGREPRKDTLVACSGSTRSMLVQLNQPQAQRVYESAETLYYVIAGQGAVNVDGRDVGLQAGAYVSLPRGVGHSITRKGNRPLILLAILSGEPCDTAK